MDKNLKHTSSVTNANKCENQTNIRQQKMGNLLCNTSKVKRQQQLQNVLHFINEISLANINMYKTVRCFFIVLISLFPFSLSLFFQKNVNLCFIYQFYNISSVRLTSSSSSSSTSIRGNSEKEPSKNRPTEPRGPQTSRLAGSEAWVCLSGGFRLNAINCFVHN